MADKTKQLSLLEALHFCPADGWFGDPMPMYHDGVWHIYYTKRLTDERMTWGHISSSDLVHYTEHPDPFPAGVSGTPFNTGCVVWGYGKFHAFYAGKTADGRHAMLRAESEDGIHFAPSNEICFLRPEQFYRNDRTFRDPAVVYDAEAKLWRMVYCVKSPRGKTADPFPGVIGRAESHDLIHWKSLPPYELTGIASTMECPDLFPIGEGWAMIYYWHETRVRFAASADGPWERGKVISPDHFDFMAARHATDGVRHMVFGWLPRRGCDCAERTWGGNFCFPREWRFGKNTPRSRFAEEVDEFFSLPAAEMLPERAILCSDGWCVEGESFEADPRNGGALLAFETMPQVCRVQFDLSIDDALGTVAILLSTTDYSGEDEWLGLGYQILIDPSEGMIRLRKHYEWDQRPDIAVIPFVFPVNQSIHVDLLIDDTILEASIDGAQTLVSRMLEARGGGFGISVWDTHAKIENFRCTRPKE